MNSRSNFSNGFEKVARSPEDNEHIKLHERGSAATSRKMRNWGYGLGLPALAAGFYASRKGHKWTGRGLKAAGSLSSLLGYAGENELYQRQRQEAALRRHEADHKKIAAPAWFHRLHESTTPLKSMKNQSRVGLKSMKAAKGLGK